MKDPKESYDRDAFEDLLKEFMLEEQVRDRSADEWLESEAERVFGSEPEHIPAKEKEEALIAALNDKLAGTGAQGGSSKAWWLAGLLLLLGVGAFFGVWYTLDSNNNPVAQQDAPADLPAIDDMQPIGPSLPNWGLTGIDPVVVNASVINTTLAYTQVVDTNLRAPVSSAALNVSLAGSLANDPRSLTGGKPIDLKKTLLKELQRRLDLFHKHLPEERVYLHTDRNYYLPGQNIWFAAFVRQGEDLTPSDRSEIVWLELLNKQGQVVMSRQLVVKNGMAPGELVLDERLPGGAYTLKAYTQWQLNNNKEYIFSKPVFIQSLAGVDNFVGVTPSLSKVEFYPEGGYLVNGITSRVALQMVDANGQGIDGSGKVMDGNGTFITTLVAGADGRGYFELTPEYGEEYTAIINGKKFKLPTSLPSGMSLRTELAEKQKLTVLISSTRKDKVMLVGLIRGQMVYSGEFNVKPGDNEVEVPLGQLPMGVLQLSLFDSRGAGQAERLVFINKHKQLQVKLSTDKPGYQPREQVTVKVKVTDPQGKPVSTNLSLAVVDDQLYQRSGAGQSNILAGLYLEPDLNRPVTDGGRYFDPTNSMANEDLDLLLMTAGWRRFNWKEVYYGQYNVPGIAAEKAVLKGRILDGSTKKPLAGVKISHKPTGIKTTTAADGSFIIPQIDLTSPVELSLSHSIGLMFYVVNRYSGDLTILYYGDARWVYQTMPSEQLHPVITGKMKLPKPSSALIGRVVNNFGYGVPNARLTARGDNDKVYELITNDQGFYTLILAQETTVDVTVEANGYQPVKKHDVTLNEKDVVLLDLLLDKRDALETASFAYPLQHDDYLDKRYGFLPKSVNIAQTNLPKQVDNDIWFDNVRQPVSINKNTVYYVDGARLHYGDEARIPAAVVGKVSYYDNGVPAKYGGAGDVVIDISSGANINTVLYHNGVFQSESKPDGFGALYIQSREFPQITYGPRDKGDDRSDLRSTLYWNGKVTTNSNGEATITFYTSDDVTQFRLIAEGVGDAGVAGRGEATAQIQMPFDLWAGIPHTVSPGELSIPLAFDNIAGKQMTGSWSFETPAGIEPVWPLPKDFTLFPLRNDTVYAKFNVLPRYGTDTLKIFFSGYGYQDVFSKEIVIQPQRQGN